MAGGFILNNRRRRSLSAACRWQRPCAAGWGAASSSLSAVPSDRARPGPRAERLGRAAPAAPAAPGGGFGPWSLVPGPGGRFQSQPVSACVGETSKSMLLSLKSIKFKKKMTSLWRKYICYFLPFSSFCLTSMKNEMPTSELIITLSGDDAV